MYWHQEGIWHNENGPAVVYANGEKGWCLYDQFYGKGEKPSELYLDKLRMINDNNSV